MNTTTPKISHRYQKRLLIPWVAISGYSPGQIRKKCILEFSDGITGEVVKVDEVHIVSNPAIDLVKSLYNMSVAQYMREWYNRIPQMSSMWFLDLTVKEVRPENGEKPQ